jgi:hypothetical protein
MSRRRHIAFVVLAACLAGCVQSGAALVSGSPAQVVVSASPAASGDPASSPPGAGLITIGRQDEGTAIVVPRDAHVLVKLGTDLMWTVSVRDPAILVPVPGVMLVQGAQALYLASQTGRTTIVGVGDPACRSSQPPCMAPSLEWSVTVVVD